VATSVAAADAASLFAALAAEAHEEASDAARTLADKTA
jgi:hypothetical protein